MEYVQDELDEDELEELMAPAPAPQAAQAAQDQDQALVPGQWHEGQQPGVEGWGDVSRFVDLMEEFERKEAQAPHKVRSVMDLRCTDGLACRPSAS